MTEALAMMVRKIGLVAAMVLSSGSVVAQSSDAPSSDPVSEAAAPEHSTHSPAQLAAEPAAQPTGSAAPHAALSVDELWVRYDEQATAFEQLNAECDSGDIATTRVNRICRQAAEASLALAETIQVILERDELLSDEERELLLDGLLTNRQIAGALWVDLGECATGRELLVELRSHEGIEVRPVVVQATERWIARADACLAAEESVAPPLAVAEEGVPARGASKIGPIVLLASGAAVLAGGFLWDMALTGQRRDFDDLRDQCVDRTCTDDEWDTLEGLRDDLKPARAPIAVLYGTGAAVAAGGAVWLVIANRQGRNDEQRVQLFPSIAPDHVGGAVRVQF